MEREGERTWDKVTKTEKERGNGREKKRKEGRKRDREGFGRELKKIRCHHFIQWKKNKCPKLTMKLSIAVEKAGQINGSAMKLCTEKTTLQFQIMGGGGGPTDDRNINKRGVQIKGGRGVWKMFSVKSGNPLSLIMGVPYNYLWYRSTNITFHAVFISI